MYLFDIYFGVFGYIILLIIIIYNAFKKKNNEKFVDEFIYNDLTKYFTSLKPYLKTLLLNIIKKEK